jgi:DNA-3-methyladenine glycosylase
MVDHSQAHRMPILAPTFFERSVYEVAPELIGCYLSTKIDDVQVRGMIIEAEAYREDDPFAHCFFDSEITPPKDSAPMFGKPGSLYFYYSGQLPCINLVCEREGLGSAVLIRALLPTHRLDVMFDRRTSWYKEKGKPIPSYLQRATTRDKNLCNGPGVLSEAIGISDDRVKGSKSVLDPPLEIRQAVERQALVSGIRIGLVAQFNKWKRDNNPRAKLLPRINEFGAKKWRWGAADYRSYCRFSSFEQTWRDLE